MLQIISILQLFFKIMILIIIIIILIINNNNSLLFIKAFLCNKQNNKLVTVAYQKMLFNILYVSWRNQFVSITVIFKAFTVEIFKTDLSNNTK